MSVRVWVCLAGGARHSGVEQQEVPAPSAAGALGRGRDALAPPHVVQPVLQRAQPANARRRVRRLRDARRGRSGERSSWRVQVRRRKWSRQWTREGRKGSGRTGGKWEGARRSARERSPRRGPATLQRHR